MGSINYQHSFEFEKPNSSIDKIIAALLGAAMGDALGWPQERLGSRYGRSTKSPNEQIRVDFQAWTRRVGGRFFSFEEHIDPGEYSDDTQLILSGIRSLSYGSDWINEFRCHELPLWLLYERGGGGTTKQSAECWLRAAPPWDTSKCGSDKVKRYFNAGGNGVAMRILPHALLPNQNEKITFEQVMLNGISTHGHPRALLGALVYADALCLALSMHGNIKLGAIIEKLIENKNHWSVIPEWGQNSYEWYDIANKHLDHSFSDEWNSTVKEILYGLNICHEAIKKGALAVDDETLERIGCFNPEISGAGTVAALAAIYISSRYASDPKTGMLEAAFAIGADTDTIASMTGALLGALLGTEWILAQWRSVQDYDYIYRVGQQIANSSLREIQDTSRINSWSPKDNSLIFHQIENGVESIDLNSLGKAKVIKTINHRPLTRSAVAKSWKLVTANGQTVYISKLSRIKETLTGKTQHLEEKTTNKSDTEIVLSLDAFIRSIGVNKSTSHSFFLGSGASVSSGMPSAEQCIWEWKRNIFLTKNPGLEEQFSELSLVGVRERIQKWFDQQGTYPKEGDPAEYGLYMESCFPIPTDRRAYFQEKVRLTQPHTGYSMLCQLAQINMIQTVWTTNFDSLMARAASTFNLIPIEIGIDSQHRLPRVPRNGELLCISLHGDFRYDHLKNTASELQQQEEQLRTHLVLNLREMPVIVVGYSGRDISIMNAFQEAYSKPGTGILYWCGYGSTTPPDNVINLIRYARQNGHSAYYVPIEGFDDLLLRTALHCCEGEHQETIKLLIANMAKDSQKNNRLPFKVKDALTHTIIKSNAFEMECPSEILTFDLQKWPTKRTWATIKNTVSNYPIVAAPFRGKILALGVIDDIKKAFGDNIKDQIKRTPITEEELRFEDGVVVSMMREALVKAISWRIGVKTNNKNSLWSSQQIERITRQGIEYCVYDSVLVFIRRIGSKQYLLLKPSLWIQDQNGKPAAKELIKDVKYRILGSQFNDKFNQAIMKWRDKLFVGSNSQVSFEFPDNCASSFRFKIRRSPVFAEIGTNSRSYPVTLPDNARSLVQHSGFELEEPNLLFADKSATRYVKDTHPIRGIVNNRPYDYGLTQRGLTSSIRLGVICPKLDSQRLKAYLDGALRKYQPLRPNPEYLLEYPGFIQAYGLALEIPDCQGQGWAICPEPAHKNPIEGSRELANRIIESIDALMASYDPQEILIFYPERWAQLRDYTTDNDHFDLHDFVKAYCVQKGIATQFLEDDTLKHEDQCSVWWWLSLAFYAKSMRTPWVLESMDPDTAFVGLGFSVNPHVQKAQQVILGCSHIYSSQGEGLQFRLSKIENPIFRGVNPFMSEEDARRLGETIRQLFFNSRMKLPKRVVIHKQTPFIRQEREGLSQGLNGVEHIEMLEIQIDHALRYVASAWRNGRFDEDNFPVRRGTVVKLDDFTCLIWVHGATAALNPQLRYFQGRRRIPAPIIVRRHVGNSDLWTIASEILGLSKMDWNTFDLYTKLPATVYTSSEIARIGSLLQRFGPHSYDFRLFM